MTTLETVFNPMSAWASGMCIGFHCLHYVVMRSYGEILLVKYRQVCVSKLRGATLVAKATVAAV